jgi:hypothetical protein
MSPISRLARPRYLIRVVTAPTPVSDITNLKMRCDRLPITSGLEQHVYDRSRAITTVSDMTYTSQTILTCYLTFVALMLSDFRYVLWGGHAESSRERKSVIGGT